MARISSIILALALMALGAEAFAPRPAVMVRALCPAVLRRPAVSAR